MSKSDMYIILENELKTYKNLMLQASDMILDEDVTNYPIFVAHQQELEIGVPLIGESKDSNWSIHASSLEEFVTKQIIFQEKIEEFKTNYKDPKQSLCIFVLSELGAQFIFMPR